MSRLRILVLLIAAAALAGTVAACGDDDDGDSSGVTAVDSDACGDVEFGGDGDADVLIVSDLPLQGDSEERSTQMNDAIRQVLDTAEWQAGDTKVAFQACDDSLADTGEWDEAQCQDNATAYSENEDVVGVVGTYNSGCAAEEIPILNEASDGGVAMVSPGNTFICLTQASPQCDPGQPKNLYPSGTQNYARVVPNDAAQGAGLAQFAEQQDINSPFILYAADDPTSQGQADTFRGAANQLGMDLAGYDIWDPEATDFTALMERVKDSDADAVLLAGLLDQNGAQLIKDKVAVLGDNETVKLLAPDGFAQQATIDEAGPDSRGMFVSVPGRTPETLTGPGKELVTELEAELDGEPVELFAPYSGQAAALILQAIEEAGASREEVIEGVFDAQVRNGIVGDFSISPSGDPLTNPISVSVAGEEFTLEEEVLPDEELITAAREG